MKAVVAWRHRRSVLKRPPPLCNVLAESRSLQDEEDGSWRVSRTSCLSVGDALIVHKPCGLQLSRMTAEVLKEGS